jgi:CheY-like chemotaxis protein
MNDRRVLEIPCSTLNAHVEKPCILVVDDEKRIADTLTLILRSKGYAAEASYDGASGLDVCRRLRPNLVVSDVVMPVMNGIEMATVIRKEYPSCHILLFSGQAATTKLLEQAQAEGHQFEMLAKPIHPEQLLERVAQLIGPAVTSTIAANLNAAT